jgi:hypothetical protein
MKPIYGDPNALESEIDGHYRPGLDRIVRCKFGAVARVLWPHKTEAHVAAIARVDVRTARRWLAGEFPPAISVVEAVIHETFKLQ